MRLNWTLMWISLSCLPTFAASDASELDWKAWSQPAIFEQAKREHKFVLLDLEAVWCHWCHVMDETTYKDPATIALLKSRYITVRVDQDSRPDLSNRYEDYGWPATVVFDENGKELVKRQGYIPPVRMASMLKAIIDDPTPGPSIQKEEPVEFPATATVPPAMRADLTRRFLANYDQKLGSWGTRQKYMDWDGVEYALALSLDGDKRAERMAMQTLDAQRLNLIDPVWGGVYQYSAGNTWKEPHFEKIMLFQAANLRTFALAFAQVQKPEYLKAAVDIHRFLRDFLTSEDGAFFTSMNADLIDGEHSAAYFALPDAERRKKGIPRVDKHVYARENGWAIEAITALYEVTGDIHYLDEAVRAANWIVANRSFEGGGFRHDSKDAAGPFLGDTLAMTTGFLRLYEATGDRSWLVKAVDGAHYIAANFRNTHGAGFVTSAGEPPEHDENIALARTAALLHQYSGDAAVRGTAEEALRYAAAPGIASQYAAAGLLLADRELNRPPVHLTVTGHKDDPAAKELFAAALRYPSRYKRVELWDRREGTLPNADVEYPELAQAAAFVCTDKSCSAPIRKADQVLARARGLAHSVQ